MQNIYSSQVIEFLTVAAEYCATVEQCRQQDKKHLVSTITKLLPLIYVKATLLPAMEEEDADMMLPEVVGEEDYNFVRQSVWSVLGEDDDYLEVFSQDMQFSESAVTASISEDLSDIYQDLKNFCAIYADRNEACMESAIARVQENFRQYWGQKLVNAMRPLHQLMVSCLDAEPGMEENGTGSDETEY